MAVDPFGPSRKVHASRSDPVAPVNESVPLVSSSTLNAFLAAGGVRAGKNSGPVA